jgi:hypothetical protein
MSQGHYGVVHGVQRAMRCMNMSTLIILIQESHYTNLPQAFLFIYNLTKH